MSKQAATPSLFLPGLTLVFIYLKMTGQLAWSWFWVLSPLFVPLTIAIIVVLIAVLIGSIIEALR